MSHIKGPLYVHSYAPDSHSIKTHASGQEVANCRTLDNARLFAASPDLLAACLGLISILDQLDPDITMSQLEIQQANEALGIARAAIAAARGEIDQ